MMTKKSIKTKESADIKPIQANKAEVKTESLDLSKFDNLINLIEKAENINSIKPQIIEHIKNIIKTSSLENTEVVFLFDPDTSIRDYTADQIYNSLSRLNKPIKNLLLLIHSRWGSIEPAYLISKCCKEFAEKFIVVVPRLAKSAATLISLGADEIHMGQMSQLGPIDPQINGLPALGLGNAVEYLASLCKKYPEANEMLAKYLSFKLNLNMLWYFERVTESAAQYAQRLLESTKLPSNKNPLNIAASFVYSYKDHGFVIDHKEAKKHLGDIIKVNTSEYKMADNIHKFLENVKLIAKILKKKKMSLIGSIDNWLLFSEIKEEK